MATTVVTGGNVLEREAELRAIEEAAASASDGRGSLVVVEGEAGIGKSALVAAARAAAEAGGTRVLRARGGELERDFGFGVVRQWLEPVLADAPAGVRDDLFQGPAGEAARRLGLPGAGRPPADATDPSFIVLHGLYWLCANLAARSPLLLALDDAHWADGASLRLLAFLLPRLEELPLALLVATRPEADGAAGPLLAALTADPGARVLRPAPLSPAGVARLVQLGLGSPPAPAFAAACHRATGGVPFLVGELVAALRDAGIVPSGAAAGRVEGLGGRAVGRAIRLRLGRLPSPATRLAEAVGILESGSLTEAAELAGLDADIAAGAADALAAAGILRPERPLAFLHPIVRVAVLEAVPAAARGRAHRRAAEVLAGRGVADECVAEHFLVAEPRGDPWTVDWLTRAARTAASRGAPESAVTYLRRALAEPPSATIRPAVLVALGAAEVACGDAQGEPRLREALDTAGDDDVRLEAAVMLGHVLGRTERVGSAVEVLDRAAARLSAADGRGRALLESMALGAGMLDAATAPGLASRLEALRAAARAPDASREVLGVAALAAMHANEPAADCAALARRALAAGPRAVPETADVPWFAQVTATLVCADLHEEAQAALDAGVAEARRTGDPSLFAACHAHRAWLRLRRGDLRGAEADARAVLEVGALVAPAWYRKLAASTLAGALAQQGQVESATAILHGCEGEMGARTQTSAALRSVRGRLLVAQRRPAEGLADLLAAGEVARATGLRCPAYLPWRSAAAHAHLALGDRDAALALVDEEVALARGFGAQRTLGVALRSAGVLHGDEQPLRESLACLEHAGVALERARTLAALGALLRRANRRTEARELLRDALDVAHHAGAAPLRDRVEAELRATGARPRRAVLTGAEALTASERRVAELAADGLTNREIAQALFVTMRTVEGHLTGAFGKLGVRSRRELPAALG